MLEYHVGPRSAAGKRLVSACDALFQRPRSRRVVFGILLGLVELKLGTPVEIDLFDAIVRRPVSDWREFPQLPGWPPERLHQRTDLPETLPADPRLLEALRQAAGVLARLQWPAPDEDARPRDWFGPLYAGLVGSPARRRLGEHYTPRWVASRLMGHLPWPGTRTGRLLDPACGSGVFLLEALDRLRRAFPRDRPQQWLDRITGIDINPLAVRAARLNLKLALSRFEHASRLKPAVRLADALELVPPNPPLEQPAAVVVGNPPWVSWERLAPAQRAHAGALWKPLGLFPHSLQEARMGAGKKDLSMLFVMLAATRWLEPGGAFGWVVPRSLANSAAAAGLRQQCVEGPLEVTLAEDLARLNVFGDAPAPAMLLVGRQRTAVGGSAVPRKTEVPWFEWEQAARPPANSTLETVLAATVRHQLALRLDPKRDHGAPWLPLPPQAQEVLEVLDRLARRPHYQAREGANTGGANGVFWLEVVPGDRHDAPGGEVVEQHSDPRAARGGAREEAPDLVCVRNIPQAGRKTLEQLEVRIAPRWIHPLLKGRDIRRWHARPSGHILVVQDPERRRGIARETLRRESPSALAYLERFEEFLSNRPLFLKFFRHTSAPWYSIYNVGPYTFAPVKVGWREQARQVVAAVIETASGSRPVIPDHKVMFVACAGREEAHYLCAVLNAPLVTTLARRFCTTTSMGSRLLRLIPIPRFDPLDPVHQALARFSRKAHAAQRDQRAGDPSAQPGTLDALAARALGLPNAFSSTSIAHAGTD